MIEWVWPVTPPTLPATVALRELSSWEHLPLLPTKTRHVTSSRANGSPSPEGFPTSIIEEDSFPRKEVRGKLRGESQVSNLSGKAG